MPDDRADRTAALAHELDRLDPPDVRGARSALQRAREDLTTLVRRAAAPHVLEAHRYRVERAGDVLLEAQRREAAPARC